MSDTSQPNRVRFPRKSLSELERKIREKRRKRKMNQGLIVSDEEEEDPVVELAEGNN